MNFWNERTSRKIAFLLGLFLTYCEASGTYEYLIKDQGEFNYIVKGGIGIAISAAVLPVFAGIASRRGQRLAAVGLWLLFPLAVMVVFAAAIQRTGGTADIAQQDRAKAERTRKLAEKTEKEATAELETATEAAKTECKSGRGSKCLEAEGKRDTARTAVNNAREVLNKAPVEQVDPLARRIVEFTGHRITEDQVRLYQPLFIPFALSIFAGVFLSLGTHMDHSSGSSPSKPGRLHTWWQRGNVRNKEETTAAEIIAPDSPAPTTAIERQKPKLVSSDQSPAVSLIDFAAAALERASLGCEVGFDDFYFAYWEHCSSINGRAVTPEEAAELMNSLCAKADILIVCRGKKRFLKGVRFKTAKASIAAT
jgi:hypothetical protein